MILLLEIEIFLSRYENWFTGFWDEANRLQSQLHFRSYHPSLFNSLTSSELERRLEHEASEVAAIAAEARNAREVVARVRAQRRAVRAQKKNLVSHLASLRESGSFLRHFVQTVPPSPL